MALNIADNFKYQGKKPNFERDSFATKAAMKAFPETDIDEGHIAYCAEDGKHYVYSSKNPVDGTTGKWKLYLGDYALKEEVTSHITEYNVSKHHPTSGIGGTNKFTLAEAIKLIPQELRSVGIKCSFLDDAGNNCTYEYQGGSFAELSTWGLIGFNGLKDLSGKLLGKTIVANVSKGQHLTNNNTRILLSGESDGYVLFHGIDFALVQDEKKASILDCNRPISDHLYYVNVANKKSINLYRENLKQDTTVEFTFFPNGIAAELANLINKGVQYMTEIVTPVILRDGVYVTPSLGFASYAPYAIYKPFYLYAGDKVYLECTTNNASLKLAQCNEDATKVYKSLCPGENLGVPVVYTATENGYVCISHIKEHKLFIEVKRKIEHCFATKDVENKITDAQKKLANIEKDLTISSKLVTTKSHNLYDSTKATKGFYIDYKGDLAASGDHYASDFVSISSGKSYTFPVDLKFFGSNIAKNICMYDSSKKFIGTTTGVLNGVLLTITIENQLAKYIRTTVVTRPRFQYAWGESHDTYMIVEGSSYPSRYYPFGEIHTYQPFEFSDKVNAMVNPLFGKSVIFDGDSICSADTDAEKYGWAGRIGTKNNMLWQNWGVGGGTITKITGAHCISEQDYGSAKPDYIIIDGGTNDADNIGSILKGANPPKYGSYQLTGYAGPFDTSTFCGAVEYLFHRWLTNYPKAKVGVIIAQKMGVSNDYTKDGNNRRAYFETLMILCKKWGIPYLNLWDEGRLNPSIASHYTKESPESFYTDGQHLTPNGYAYISTIIEEWMKTL